MGSFTALLLQLSLLNRVTFATTFRPNCTIPPNGTNFVGAPNVRSTTDILWSSLYTIFICTWVIQHLNVPRRGTRHDSFRIWRRLRWFPPMFWNRVEWMIMTLIAPEILVGNALSDRISVHRFGRREDMKDFKYEWTSTHGYYANQGGFTLHGEVKAPLRDDNARFILPIAVNSSQISYLLKKELISAHPPISKQEIDDKSKGDYFAKGSALLQFLWLIVQLITRRLQGLRSSQLEIMALSFAVSSIFTYALWFGKPQNVQVSTQIHLRRELVDEDITELKGMTGDKQLGTSGSHISAVETSPDSDIELFKSRRSSTAAPEVIFLDFFNVGIGLGAVILGACHCIAWNFDFPTPVERLLWRIASVVSTIVIPLGFLLDRILLIPSENRLISMLKPCIVWSTVLIYIISRLYLVVAPFRDLFYLPPEAFIATWTMHFPHFA